MGLPVDKPFFYMSPCEFQMLPRGCYVKNVQVEVIMHNPRTAFETNASTSNLATLNQVKFIAHAVGTYIKRTLPDCRRYT